MNTNTSRKTAARKTARSRNTASSAVAKSTVTAVKTSAVASKSARKKVGQKASKTASKKGSKKALQKVAKKKAVARKASQPPVLTLDVQFGVARTDVPTPRRLQQWADAAYRVHHASFAGRRRITPVQVSLRIVGAAESRQLNHTWRDKDYATNVLSFPAGEVPECGDELPSLGDLAICVPVVKREAREQGKTLDSHWAHMVIHGVLHLLGYDHEVERDAQVMEACEVALMQSFGFANPYETDSFSTTD